ncbi:helix-turn-helix domain-containing protein [Nocardioides sp. NBC_00850]|uniref:PucR family transcriptional regulator n=1 Tax=Nocardioides sp. NBC_00850 TaxID=2976001 RepID=UPI0038659C55|nr:helix-turn-helix domain-containing protein [Nocardioides sp. NBC_00850]
MEDEELRGQVATVASALNDRLGELTCLIRDVLASRIVELQGDAAIIDLLESSVAGNVENILHSLRHWIPVEKIEPPSAAFEYARRLAQRGVPVNALVRAYRLGQQHLLKEAYAECLRRHSAPDVQAAVYQRIVTVTFDYIDWISQRVVTVYETEHERWLTERNTARFGRIQDLISGATDDVDASESIIGHRLRVRHLGVVLWVHETGAQQDQLTRFNRAVSAVAEEFGSGSPLVVSRDRASAWAWIPVPDGFSPDPVVIRPLLDHAAGPPLPMIAFGRPHAGLAGFRQTHLEAVQAQRVAMIREDPSHPVTAFNEPGLNVAALLAQDVEQTRWWVQETLGDLARDDEQHVRLRETLLLFFRHDSSYTATAEAMVMHKNSVKYRVTSAEKILGRPIGDDRQALELALTACHWLGQAVLSRD